MDLQAEIPRVPMQVTSGCLVASIQLDPTAALLRQFQQDLLERIKATGVPGIILDVSGVRVMDLDDFELLRRAMVMASVMGARPVLVGLRPGIVASLIALDGNVDGFEAAADVDDAIQRLRPAEKDGAPRAEGAAAIPDGDAGGSENANEGTDRSHLDSH